MNITSLIILLIFSIMGSPHASPKPFDSAKVIDQLPPLHLQKDSSCSEEVLSYFRFYELHYPDTINHYFGFVESDSFRLATHVFIPPRSQKSVILTHGYFDHTGIMKNVIRECVAMNYTVVAFDLPGHGLSSGARASIGDFAEYGKTFDSVLRKTNIVLPKPLILIAHSTGCAAALEYFHNFENHKFEKAIFIAPLVRGAYHNLSRIGYNILSPFMHQSWRLYRNQSSDKEFLKFLKSDPLKIDHFPLRWAKAYYNWSDRVKSYNTLSTPKGIIIQGTSDDVVDWKYNIPLLKKQFADIEPCMLEGAKHQVMNESGEYKSKFINTLRSSLTFH